MNVGLNTALQGILAAQRALDVSSHNISNANTPGYSRQRADLSATAPLGAGGIGLSYSSYGGAGMVGTGVTVASIKRVRDQFIDRQLYAENSPLAEAQVGLETIKQVEDIFGEPSDDSLNALMNKFWNAFQDLSTHADNPAYRIALREAGNNLSEGFKEIYNNLDGLRHELNDRVSTSVQDVNSLVKQVAALNKEIKTAIAVGQNPNDLKDQQDALIEKISSFAQINVYEVPSTGGKNIYLGGDPLVFDEHDYALQTVPQPPNGFYTVMVSSGSAAPTPAAIGGGSLKGLIDARDITLSDTDPRGFLTQLNALASTIVSQIDAVHQAGYALDGSQNAFFDPALNPGMNASNMAVNPLFFTSPGGLDKIAAALNDPTTAAGGKGEGGNAVKLAQLRTLKVPGIGNMTTDEYYKSTLTKAGTAGQELERKTKTQELLVGSIKDRIEQVAGVSTDEEMANIIRYQKAYAASAKVLSTIDQMLDTLLAIR